MHRELAGKYLIHGPRIEELWHGMGQAQRERAMESSTPGVIPKHFQDPSTETIDKLAPEWNLKDITTAGSDIFLHLLEHRATNSLNVQYSYGLDDWLGDGAFIIKQIRAQNLRQDEIFPDCYTFFIDGDPYGMSVQIFKNKVNVLASWGFAIDAGLCVPESEGRLVLMRQQYLLTLLCVMIETMISDSMATTLAKLSMKPLIPKLDIHGALDSALERRDSLDDDLDLIRTEPIVLANYLDTWFTSRPELVADEKGRTLPAKNHRLIGYAFLDMIHNAVRGAAIWNYIYRLLDLFETSPDKSDRHIILQEFTNMCHLEYSRLKAILKRQMSVREGAKWFNRIPNSYENGNARIALKRKPEVLARGDKQRYYLFRLCQAEATVLTAVNWMAKLGELHSNDPSLGANLHEGEIRALDELAVLATVIQSLSQATSLPAINHKSGRRFVAGAAKLEIKLNQVKSKIDLSDVAFPTSKLLKPGIAEDALKALDEVIANQMGTEISFLYLGLVDDCITELHQQLKAQHKAIENATKDIKNQYIPFPPEPPKTHGVGVHERRQKEKTRPAHSSVYETSSTDREAIAPTAAPPSPPEPFKVKPATAELFSTLFSRAESRGSIAWVNFEAALAELKFSVIPKFGSAYTFFPPESMAIQKPVTLHRPHKSRIEGCVLLIFARRLNRLYGWKECTFQTI
ncbi:hypothetical protein F4782DRAFT_542671 [Xylaria castorea]|nr:hypothetical protein F4782DRAFT_542671 [Xylaria castorea]